MEVHACWINGVILFVDDYLIVSPGCLPFDDPDQDQWSKISQIMVHQSTCSNESLLWVLLWVPLMYQDPSECESLIATRLSCKEICTIISNGCIELRYLADFNGYFSWQGCLSPSNYNHSCQNKQTVHKKNWKNMYLHKFIYYELTNFAVVNKIILYDVMVVYFENIVNIGKKLNQ